MLDALVRGKIIIFFERRGEERGGGGGIRVKFVSGKGQQLPQPGGEDITHYTTVKYSIVWYIQRLRPLASYNYLHKATCNNQHIFPVWRTEFLT